MHIEFTASEHISVCAQQRLTDKCNEYSYWSSIMSRAMHANPWQPQLGCQPKSKRSFSSLGTPQVTQPKVSNSKEEGLQENIPCKMEQLRICKEQVSNYHNYQKHHVKNINNDNQWAKMDKIHNQSSPPWRWLRVSGKLNMQHYAKFCPLPTQYQHMQTHSSFRICLHLGFNSSI